jgi:hypothetical protein
LQPAFTTLQTARGKKVTEQQAKSEQRVLPTVEILEVSSRKSSAQSRTTTEAVKAGLNFLMSQRRDRVWGEGATARGTRRARITACVLARLGELSSQYLNHSLRQQIQDSVDWLVQARTPEGGWGSLDNVDEAETTAWAVIALRRHDRNVPEPALNFMRRCRRLDGGFARTPEGIGAEPEGSPEITAIAARALGAIDGAAEQFLVSFLHNAGSAGPLPAESFSVCSQILDCETGIASTLLLNQAAQFAVQFRREGAMEQALLLRCLLRLRNQRAWPLAANLRALQMADGSWNGPEFQPVTQDKKILITATAVAALAQAEFQPGLYFGSDLPLPRRLTNHDGGVI